MAAIAWLVPQLTNLAEFSNCKTSFGKEQIRSCAEMIVAEYYYMKMTELMLFFYKFKNGEYGQFYGSVSPMVIMVSLRQFKRERNDAIFQHESLLKEKEREESRKGTISAEEYYAPKKKAILDYFNALVNAISLTFNINNNDKNQITINRD